MPDARAEEAVDLELVLAVDASGSVDQNELRLQLGGIAAGFRDPEVLKAITDGPLGRIAVSLLLWAQPEMRKEMTGWYVIGSRFDAGGFADAVEGFQRRLSGGTGIGAGIARAIRSMKENGIEGRRRVVDVSGDGRETPPREYVVQISQAREMANAHDVTINGLAILSDDPGLGKYYEREMITGPNAFVMTVEGFEDFAGAMRRKLLREIEFRPAVATRPGDGDRTESDQDSLALSLSEIR
ncbi:hypothetical protein OCH7691_04046 [Oceanibacterium hippocampi]|uniref:VWFA domain-containing protein n=2 Tax=Oceanibacterium hippocampi TaxID=745714 RepID=A0A1Y5TXE2_9PROT|nr:hypothetical protein OCH7691_04046 [Oceanibacterium hippocampi]